MSKCKWKIRTTSGSTTRSVQHDTWGEFVEHKAEEAKNNTKIYNKN